MIDVPLHDELTIAVDVDVTWGMVTLPPDEYVAAASKLPHTLETLSPVETFCNELHHEQCHLLQD